MRKKDILLYQLDIPTLITARQSIPTNITLNPYHTSAVNYREFGGLVQAGKNNRPVKFSHYPYVSFIASELPEKFCRPALVQGGRNNPPVKKGSKAYCKSNIPSALEPPYFCLLALGFARGSLLEAWLVTTDN